MRMVDLIEKKRDGKELSKEEIFYIIESYTNGILPDYQMSALTMAIYFQGMTDDESYYLTDAILQSGDVIDLSEIKGIKVDKHSTGGVGDKTTLVIGPVVAAMGVKLAKLSGRGLGHTGGTLDKLESIEGLSINIPIDKFINQVNEIGIAVAGQTKNLTNADKLLYALRDVTATVPSMPLIASSIMSKKLASGADIIVLDVKVGSGAFMKTLEEAKELSTLMVNIGKKFNKETVAIITNMNQPLGKAIGNKLEVLEAIDTINGVGPSDFTDLCIEIASYLVYKANVYSTLEKAREGVTDCLSKGLAYNTFQKFISAQGGNIKNLYENSKVKNIIEIKSTMNGYIEKIDALSIGLSAMKLGAGREQKSDMIDPNVGIVLNKKIGDTICKDEILAYIYTNGKNTEEVTSECYNAFTISQEYVEKPNIILDIIH